MVHARILIGALVPLVVAVGAQTLYSLASQRAAMDDGLENKARALASLMVNVAGPSLAFDDAKAVRDGLGYVTSDPDFAFAVATDADGKRVAAVGAVGPGDAGAIAAATITHRGDQVIAATPVVTDGHQVGSVFIGLRGDRVQAQVTHMAAWAAGISILGVAIATLVVLVLAGKIARRNDQMRLVLDNVDEALATLRRDGTLEPECSAAFTRWFGAPAGGHFAARLASHDATAAAMLRLAWDQLVEGLLPRELTLDQLPHALERDARHYWLDLKPLLSGDVLTGALLRVRDVTSEIEAQRTLAAQREYVTIFERALADPTGLAEFVEDTGRLVTSLPDVGLASVDRKRNAHTIKGNAAVFGVDSVATVAHRIEEHLFDDREVPPRELTELASVWREFAGRVDALLSRGTAHHVHVPRNELEYAVAELALSAPDVATALRGWLLEPVAGRFEQLRRQFTLVASRLGKAVEVTVEAGDVRLPGERLRGFWTTFAHLVRNAIDHGVEPPATRLALGKPRAGQIALRARRRGTIVELELTDDGAGVDWERVRAKARAASLPAESHEDLVQAMFTDGVTTAAETTTTSGRGVGLAAVWAATIAANGRIEVASERGRGTRLTFTFDLRAARSPSTRIALVPETDAAARLS
jgi:two-component system chemotaxis sensor kinase CheA